MNNKYPFLAMAGLLAAVVVLRGQGQETAADSVVGKVLLLRTERTMEGDVERVGKQYRIKRQQGEVWIGADKVLKVCRDWDEIVEYLRGRANLGDPDERLRLARWFQLNGRRQEALVEAEAALQLRPGHPPTKQMVMVLQRQVATEETAVAGPGSAPVPKVEPAPAIDISSEAVAHFTKRVQPILMNTCATCHTQGRGGSFQLFRTNEGGSRGSTLRNLASALAQVDPHRPVLSPLLIKAVSAHGADDRPPLLGKKTIPYQALAEWVDRTLAANPHLREQGDAARLDRETETPRFAQAGSLPPGKGRVEVVSREQPRINAEPGQPKIPTKGTGPVVVAKTPETISAPATNPMKQEVQAAPASNDPFDPEQFNRLGRPK